MRLNNVDELIGLFGLSGKTAVITGGYGYLGAEITRAVVAAGAEVFVLGRDSRKYNEAFQTMEAVSFVECDVSNSESVTKAFEEIERQNEHLDILVNNAYYAASSGSFETESDENIAYTLDGTVGQTYRVTRAALPLLKAAPAGAVIVNVSSMYACVSPVPQVYDSTNAIPNPIIYGAGKAGVEQLTRYLAVFAAPYGIRVNAIAPGAFPDPSKVDDDDFKVALAEQTPLKRIGAPSDLSAAVLYLCSSGASFVTGQVIHVDGGWTIV